MLEKVKYYLGFSEKKIVISKATVGDLHVLPLDTLREIFGFLPFQDFRSLLLTSKTMKRIGESSTVTLRIPSLVPNLGEYEVANTYKNLIPMFNKMKNIQRRNKFAYPNEQSRETSHTTMAWNIVKFLGGTLIFCIALAISRGFFGEYNVVGKSLPSIEKSMIFLLSILSLSLIISICYVIRELCNNNTTKKQLDDELRKTVENYTPKQKLA